MSFGGLMNQVPEINTLNGVLSPEHGGTGIYIGKTKTFSSNGGSIFRISIFDPDEHFPMNLCGFNVKFKNLVFDKDVSNQKIIVRLGVRQGISDRDTTNYLNLLNIRFMYANGGTTVGGGKIFKINYTSRNNISFDNYSNPQVTRAMYKTMNFFNFNTPAYIKDTNNNIINNFSACYFDGAREASPEYFYLPNQANIIICLSNDQVNSSIKYTGEVTVDYLYYEQ